MLLLTVNERLSHAAPDASPAAVRERSVAFASRQPLNAALAALLERSRRHGEEHPGSTLELRLLSVAVLDENADDGLLAAMGAVLLETSATAASVPAPRAVAAVTPETVVISAQDGAQRTVILDLLHDLTDDGRLSLVDEANRRRCHAMGGWWRLVDFNAGQPSFLEFLRTDAPEEQDRVLTPGVDALFEAQSRPDAQRRILALRRQYFPD